MFGQRRTGTAKVGIGAAIAGGGRVRGIVSPGETASLDERVAFLLRQSERTQEKLAHLETTLAKLPGEWKRDIASARDELLQRIERRLTETQEKYLVARRLGPVSLLLGVALVSGSNL